MAINYKIIHTERQIRERVDDLACEMMDLGVQPNDVFICLLNGGLFFYSDLLRALCRRGLEGIKLMFLKPHTIETDGIKKVKIDGLIEEVPIIEAINNGADIWIIDEIMDSGRSVTTVIDWLMGRFAHNGAVKKPYINTVMMIERKGVVVDPRVHTHLVGFTEDRDEWFVGYGMDGSNGILRAMPMIAIETPLKDDDEPEL